MRHDEGHLRSFEHSILAIIDRIFQRNELLECLGVTIKIPSVARALPHPAAHYYHCRVVHPALSCTTGGAVPLEAQWHTDERHLGPACQGENINSAISFGGGDYGISSEGLVIFLKAGSLRVQLRCG